MRSLILFALSLTVSLAAHADTVQTFDFFSVLGSNIPGNAIGTVGLDLDTGQIVGADITVSSIYSGTFTMPPITLANPVPPGLTSVAFEYFYLYPGSTPAAGSDYTIILDLLLPVSDLHGYLGGPVCSSEFPCDQVSTISISADSYGPLGGGPGYYGQDTLQFGSLTPETPVTPEPSSLILLLSGLPVVLAAARVRVQRDR